MYVVFEIALATIAQSVERLIRNQQVAGPSPASSSTKRRFQKKRRLILWIQILEVYLCYR